VHHRHHVHHVQHRHHEHHGPTLPEGAPYVILSEATGGFASAIDGTYVQTWTMNGWPLYRKFHNPDLWLRFVAQGDKWVVSRTEAKDLNNGDGYSLEGVTWDKHGSMDEPGAALWHPSIELPVGHVQANVDVTKPAYVVDTPVVQPPPSMAHVNYSPASAASSQSFDCISGLQSWQTGWTITQKMWCCDHQNVKCEALFDCQAGLSNWQNGWSSPKKRWCCENRNLGCGS